MNEIKALHRQAMEQADLALAAQQSGEEAQAQSHFRQAYDLESKAAVSLTNDLTAEPARSVLFRSAASLALDCGLFQEAKRLIFTALLGRPDAEIEEELRQLLDQSWANGRMRSE